MIHELLAAMGVPGEAAYPVIQGDDGAVEGDEDAVGVAVVEGLVENQDLVEDLNGLFQRGSLS